MRLWRCAYVRVYVHLSVCMYTYACPKNRMDYRNSNTLARGALECPSNEENVLFNSVGCNKEKELDTSGRSARSGGTPQYCLCAYVFLECLFSCTVVYHY
jgi:hypothetical protein